MHVGLRALFVALVFSVAACGPESSGSPDASTVVAADTGAYPDSDTGTAIEPDAAAEPPDADSVEPPDAAVRRDASAPKDGGAGPADGGAVSADGGGMASDAGPPCTAASCDDGNPCSVDSCSSSSGRCEHVAKDCDDLDPCTVDRCDGATGACSHTAKLCMGTLCAPGSCNPADGSCTTTPKVCDDKDPCTTDYCDLASGACLTRPYTGSCDDRDKCTHGDSCATGTCVGQKCDDGNVCTTDSCDLKGNCIFTPKSAMTACDDGSACTASSTCQDTKSGFRCVGLVKCGDTDACTYDACDHAAGQCTHTLVKGCTSCTLDGQCGPGAYCAGGICMGKKPLGEPCASDLQCSQGKCLDDGSGANAVCTLTGKPSGAFCRVDGECASGECFVNCGAGCSGLNVCTCKALSDCPAGEFCLVDLCKEQLLPGLPCTEDAQCQPPRKCTPTANSGNVVSVCMYDHTVPLGGFCLDSNECVTDDCFELVATCVCAKDSDCGAGNYCDLGACLPCCVTTTVCKACTPPCFPDPTCGCSCGTETATVCDPTVCN